MAWSVGRWGARSPIACAQGFYGAIGFGAASRLGGLAIPYATQLGRGGGPGRIPLDDLGRQRRGLLPEVIKRSDELGTKTVAGTVFLWIGSPISSRSRASIGIAITGCLHRITCCGRPLGIDEAARRPDSERLRVDARKTPRQGGIQAFRELLFGGRKTGARGSRAAHQPGNASGRAIDRAIFQPAPPTSAGNRHPCTNVLLAHEHRLD